MCLRNALPLPCLLYTSCEYARVVKAVQAFHKEHPEDWRACFQYLHDTFGYDKYPGNCHIIPNAGVIILALLYGNHDFSRTLNICNMCGWDTDCNVGNTGCIMGVLCGLEGIDYDKWRAPINDFLACSSVIPSLNAVDVPFGASYFAKMAYQLAGEAVSYTHLDVYKRQVYKGANGLLTAQDILQNAAAFDNASFCLLQTEVGLDAVEAAAGLACERGVKLLLKPSAVYELRDELLQKIFVFLPNEKEISYFCPPEMSCKEKARYFLDRGVKNVILTMGRSGCYWDDGIHQVHFPAAPFEACLLYTSRCV